MPAYIDNYLASDYSNAMVIKVSSQPLAEVKADLIVLPVFEETVPEWKNALKSSSVEHFLKSNPKFGKAYETQTLFTPEKQLLLIGLGKKDKLNFEVLQNWAGVGVKQQLTKSKTLTLVLPKLTALTPEQIGEAVALGIEIASHDPTQDYKSEPQKITLQTVEVVTLVDISKGLKKGQILSQAINMARNLADTPANLMTPTVFLAQVKKIASANSLKLTILTEAQAKQKGMGGFVAVASGSDEPGFMLSLEYTGNPTSKEKWGLVGKGITFDSGGLYAKPSPHMNEMKYDMCGAVAVLGAIVAASQLKLKTNLVAVMPMTENMMNGKAMKPGDILKTYSGKTAEILHTDAEGRVVLIDAVSYAEKDFRATKIIDLATLTGAVLVALSGFYTGVFSNNEKLQQQILDTGKKVGEKYWAFPMSDEFEEMIKSDYADISNVGHPDREAGSITGAKFIEAGITKNTPWVHLDIAGTAWDSKPKPYRGIGATGVGIKTLVELLC